MEKFTAIILCGGKSRRFESDKALYKIEDRTLLEIAVSKVEHICNEVLISSGNVEHHTEGATRIDDVFKEKGPLGGIYSSLLKSKNEWNLVLSVDSPGVEVDFIQFLMENVKSHDALVPFHKKGNEPLIAIYNRRILPVAEKLILNNRLKMQNLLEMTDTQYINCNEWADFYPDLFLNLNYK